MMHARTMALADRGEALEESEEERLDRVFFALSDPIRRTILSRLGGTSFLVSELAAPFDISVQAISRHIQVLVRAGLVTQERTGRISRCRLEVGPIYAAAVWINQYSEYWQAQFDALAHWLEKIDARKPRRSASKRTSKRVRGSVSKSGGKS
jgi:DNA-binding transcriptional ArsR family regulator